MNWQQYEAITLGALWLITVAAQIAIRVRRRIARRRPPLRALGDAVDRARMNL